MRGVQLSRHSAISRQITSPRSFILSASFFCSCNCAVSLLILPMRSIRSPSDCAMLRARGLFYISITYPRRTPPAARRRCDTPRADEVLVLPAAVATDLPRLQVGDQRSVARPAVEQASETVDARPAVVRGSAALAPSEPESVDHGWPLALQKANQRHSTSTLITTSSRNGLTTRS